MSAASRLLVVVPCLNEERHLPGLLDWLASAVPEGRIVVADGGSADRSRAIVESFAKHHGQVHLLDNPARIQSAGVNLAVDRFGDGAEWLLRIDAHCRYPEDYPGLLLAAADRTGADCVVVPMVTQGEACFQRAVAAAQNSVIGTGGSAHRHLGEGRFVEHGHHALMRIAAFRSVGGYREDMSHNEDAELDQRFLKHGCRIWLEPAGAIAYFPRRDALSLARQYFGYGAGRAKTVRLHRARPRLRQMLPLLVPVAVLLALAAPWCWLLGLPLLGWITLMAVAGVAVGLGQGRCEVLSGIPAMVMHLAWGSGFIRETLRPTLRP